MQNKNLLKSLVFLLILFLTSCSLSENNSDQTDEYPVSALEVLKQQKQAPNEALEAQTKESIENKTGALTSSEDELRTEELKNTNEFDNTDLKEMSDNEVLDYALQKQDTDSCLEINTKETQTYCYNRIYFDQAISEQDISFCFKIKNTSQKELCQNQIQSQKAKSQADIISCSQITDSTFKEECLNSSYFKKAIQEGKPNLCTKITERSLLQKCQQKAQTVQDQNYFSSAVNENSD